MEREAEELHLLGVGGEGFDILLRSSRSKLVYTLALTLLLPLSFATMAMCLISGPLMLPKSDQYLYDTILVENLTGNGTLRSTRVLQQPRTTNIVFVVEFWMLSTAAVFYTAASIYMASEISFAKAMAVLPIVWKRLALTLLWFLTVVLAYTTVYILAFFLLLYTAGFHKSLDSGEFLFGPIPVPVVFFCALVYINMVGYLASVISVLQEKYYSMVAMRKKKHAIKRKRSTVLVLLMLYFIFSQGIGAIFGDAVFALERRSGVLIGAKAVYGTMLNGLLCMVMLWGLVMQIEL